MAGNTLFPEVALLQDPQLQTLLARMAGVLDELAGVADGRTASPPRPFPGQVARFTAGAVGPAAGLYEFRAGAWQKL